MTAIILQCPICGNPLLNAPSGYQCSHNHTFDTAREGYVNLLPVHKKNSKEPGDSREMVKSRRRFLNLGLYDAISDSINGCFVDKRSSIANQSPLNILDAGCGEGFYLKRLKDFVALLPARLPVEYYGVDISKYAVRQATQRDRAIDWFVASVIDLPFFPASIDTVLSVFSPVKFPELSRVLREQGRLIIVTPGPRHLYGLRELIYSNVREHSASTISDEAKSLFSLISESRLNYPIELKNRDSIMDLLAMTPYFWNIDLKTKSRLEALNELVLDVDVEIRVFQKGNSI